MIPNSFTLGTFVSSIFTVSLSFLHLCTDIQSLTYLLSFLFFPMHTSRILVFAPLLPLVSLQITISSVNSIVHNGFLLTSSISLSIITANRNGLNADPLCSPTLTLKLSVVPTAHLTTVSLIIQT